MPGENSSLNNLNDFQRTEVSKVCWKSFDECLDSIRPYNLEKKEVLSRANKLISEYRLYS